MKKQIRSNLKNRYNTMGEDLRILQQMITKRSVYAKARIQMYERKPKHPKSYMEYIES